MANGHGGLRPGAGKPKGLKWASTLTKEAAREEFRKMVLPRMQELIDAQIQHALGLKYLVTRERKTGRFTQGPILDGGDPACEKQDCHGPRLRC